MSKKTNKPKAWKKHKQTLVSLHCGVRCEVDKNIAGLIEHLNRNGLETRHSCEGRNGKWGSRGYVSLFATPNALGLAHYLLENGADIDGTIEIGVHPYGYKNLVIRWPKKNQKKLEALIHNYFR